MQRKFMPELCKIETLFALIWEKTGPECVIVCTLRKVIESLTIIS